VTGPPTGPPTEQLAGLSTGPSAESLAGPLGEQLAEQLTVRMAGPEDVDLLAALRTAYAEEDQGPTDDPEFGSRFAGWHVGAAQQRLFWIAEAGSRAVGMLNLSVFERMPRPGRPGSSWGYVGNVFVLAAHRNQGIGARLLDAALAHARRCGFARVVLSPSERAIPFYARAGFRPATSLMVLEPVDGTE
jgi:GNAT superfamily N-acetyltransferase